MSDRTPPAAGTEYDQAIDQIRACCGAPEELEFFCELARSYFMPAAPGKDEVLILGPSFPASLLRAAGLRPRFVIGGGRELAASVDARLPRDADPAARSMFGYLERLLDAGDGKTPVIVPITGDSLRKLHYLLEEEGRRVYALDITPATAPERCYSSLAGQLYGLMEELSARWNLPGMRGHLRRAAETEAAARVVLRRIWTEPTLPGLLRMFLAGSYFYAPDPAQWRDRLERLGQALSGTIPPDCRPGVLLIGSPVLFPCYKVPLLLESCGLRVLGSCDCVAGRLLPAAPALPRASRAAMAYACAEDVYGNDCTGVFVRNDALLRRMESMLDVMDVRGVVFHVLKGQIEYDFELPRLEAVCAKRGLPTFRLETDYHDNDIEQLRIRLEAFSELLTREL